MRGGSSTILTAAIVLCVLLGLTMATRAATAGHRSDLAVKPPPEGYLPLVLYRCSDPRLPLGDGCSNDAECASPWCTDGVCCDTSCSGQCEACLASKTGGMDGVCDYVSAGTDPDGECTGQHPGAPGGSTDPFCSAGACDFSCLGDYYDVNGQVEDGCECLDTEQYAPLDEARWLGWMDDCDGTDFTVEGKLPYDSKHTGPFEEWYYFDFNDYETCVTEFFLLFRSPSGTSLRVSLYEGATERQTAVSNGDVVKLSDGGLTDGDYHIRVQWVSGSSCDQYEMQTGDGCCSDDCNTTTCIIFGGCGTSCPQF